LGARLTQDAERAPHEPEILRRHGRLLRRTVLVSALTLTSRVLGFVREVLAAALFGDRSGVFDAFVTAWRVPNLFRRFLGEGALSTSLQTTLTEVDADRGDEAGRRLFLRTAAALTGILVVLCAVVMVGVSLLPDALPGTGWEWLGPDAAAVRELTVRLMPFVVVVCLAALCAGALQVRGHYASPALAPVAMNVVWIAALVALGLHLGWTPAEGEHELDRARFLSWGVLIAGVVQLVVQVPALRRHGLLRRPRTVAEADEAAGGRDPSPTGARAVLRQSVPLALGAAVYQVNVLVDGLMAEGLLPDGGPSVHYFANRIQQFPLALIAVAATSAVFPALKALGHAGRHGELRALHTRTQLAIAFLALPSTAGLLALADPIAAALFEHGAYSAEGTARIGAALAHLALALLPAGAVGLLSRTYYALGDFRTPVVVSAWMLGANAVLNVAFVPGLGMDADGLALATAVTTWCNFAALLPGLRRRLGAHPDARDHRGRLARMVAASLVSGLVARGAFELAVGDAAPSSLRAAASLAGAIALAVGAYAASSALLRVPEWQVLARRVAARRERR